MQLKPIYFAGKGESIWDFQAHSADSGIRDNATGDVASDSYHRYIEDVASLAQMGVKYGSRPSVVKSQLNHENDHNSSIM